MIKLLNVIALLVFVTMIIVTIWLRSKAAKQRPALSRLPGIVMVALSAGMWGLTFQWHLDSATRVVGFPFTAAVFELHGGRWVDYVGIITLPAMAANFMFWVLLFRLPLMWYRNI